MTNQSYQYFLTEAQDLLQTIESDLFTLSEDHSRAKIHSLMRATHTLKGASANVGQETIKKISHYLEDVFRALLAPDAVIEPEVENLLFQGYECLRLALSAELWGEKVDESEVLNRAASIFAGLQDKLQYYFENQTALPTSAELGFDLTKSIFEVGVKQRLDALTSLVENAAHTDREDIASQTAEYADIFLGLAESLGLPGFQAIADCTIAALSNNPEKAAMIAQLALTDFTKGHSAVIEGDRTQGGQPSEQLKKLALKAEEIDELGDSKQAHLDSEPLVGDIELATPRELSQIESEISLEELQLSNSLPNFDLESTFSDIELPEELPPSLESTFDHFEPLFPSQLEVGDVLKLTEENLESTFGNLELSTDLPEPNLESTFGDLELPEELVVSESSEISEEKLPLSQIIDSQTKKIKPPRTIPSVRVNLEQLDQLNQLISELQINHNQLNLRDEQFQSAVNKLTNWLRKHRQTIINLRDEISQNYLQELRAGMGNHPLDILLHSALEETVQLEQAKEDIDFLADNTAQAIETEELLLVRIRDEMRSVRLIPISNLLQRFPPMVKQLSVANNKPVELQVTGTQVMVDKAITENLYDALLHLVRNAFDHGIETSDKRQELKKPVTGKITIHAFNQGNRTIIEISDDGRGLNQEKIYNRALELNLLTPEQVDNFKNSPISDAQVLQLICEPGFSTRSQVSDLSGRGIGLDVVTSQLAMIRGTLKIDSVPNQGTKFSIQIPNSLISVRLMVCEAQNQTFAFVANEIEQVVLPLSQQIKFLGEQKILQLGENRDTIPIYQLSSLLTYHLPKFSSQENSSWLNSKKINLNPILNVKSNTSPILLLRSKQKILGLEIDKIIEEQELVIKPIPDLIQPPSYIYGCTILADSSLALVIDGVTLLNYQTQPEINQQETNNQTQQNSKESATVKTFLIVDDSITQRHTLSTMLQKTGNQILQARDGIEAIEQLQKNPTTSIVICDLEMPRMNGFEFLTTIRKDPELAKIPVVMLTSRSNQQYKQIAQELGASAYLTKPYLEPELLNTLNEVISH